MNQSHRLPTPEEMAPAVDLCQRILEQLDRLLLGRHHLHRQVLTAILAKGHLLLEGLPGLGKTALVKGLGDILGLEFKRVQFTPDLMPSDILGAHILQENQAGQREMVFQAGPVFTHLLLADEINRASPKTQSALLEAMQERAVTLMGTTRALPDPFFVLASQNPIDLEGTYPLPEAQLDRFLFKLNVDQVDAGVLAEIVASRRHGEPPKINWSLARTDLDLLYEVMATIVIPRPLCDYIGRLVAATHPSSETSTAQIKACLEFGASPRAAIAIAEAARAHALIGGRPTVGFEDVRGVAPAVLNHRLILNYKGRLEGQTTTDLVNELLVAVDETGLDLNDHVHIVETH